MNYFENWQIPTCTTFPHGCRFASSYGTAMTGTFGGSLRRQQVLLLDMQHFTRRLLPTQANGSHCATGYRSFENTFQNSSREVTVATGIQVGSPKPRRCYTAPHESRRDRPGNRQATAGSTLPLPPLVQRIRGGPRRPRQGAGLVCQAFLFPGANEPDLKPKANPGAICLVGKYQLTRYAHNTSSLPGLRTCTLRKSRLMVFQTIYYCAL